MSLWTHQEAATATGGQAITEWQATGVSIDTRTLESGDLFVALTAARDGHDFVAQALDKGAAAALVAHVPEGVEATAPLLIVEDVQKALEDLGRARRAACQARVVAVTGSVGKTSTKEMLRAILSDQGRTHASVASYNNHWGVPLTLARMPRETKFAVIEIGMNHPGEIAPLARMARPHVALVTTVAPAHLEAFDDIFGIAAEKAAIFEGLEPGGVAVVNFDLNTSDILMSAASDQNARILGFGTMAPDYHLKKAQIIDDVTVVKAEVAGEPLVLKIGAPGRHFAMNGLAALAAAVEMGADFALAAHALGRWTPFKGRGARERILLDPVEEDGVIELIDESYNANPASMAAAFEVLAATAMRLDASKPRKARRIAIVGDMKELGPKGPAMHAGLAALPSLEAVDQIHCVGPLMWDLYQALTEAKRGVWTETSEELRNHLRARLHMGDIVMVKGSLSMKLGLIVDAIRKMGHGTRQSDKTTR